MFDFHIVVLDCPYDNLHDERVRQILNDTVQLKIDGFQTGYEYGVLPVDTADFVATHVLTCIKYGQKYLPICGYKSITPERAERHKITFPLFNLLRSSNAEIQERAVLEIMEQAKKENKQVRWEYSYTILPSIRNNREAVKATKEIMMGLQVLSHNYFNTDIVFASGVCKYKMNEMFYTWGYEDILYKDEPIPFIKQTSLWNEEVQLMKLTSFSEEAKMLAKKYQDLWNNRLEIEAKDINKVLKAA